MPDPLRHHRKHRTKSLFGDSPAEIAAEKFASFMGTVRFLVISSALILAWVLSNHAIHFLKASWHGLEKGEGFDPAPFILLNLVFSAFAFYTGALVIIAAKSEAKKNKAREEADAQHREELNAKLIELLEANTKLTEADKDLTEQIHRLVSAR